MLVEYLATNKICVKEVRLRVVVVADVNRLSEAHSISVGILGIGSQGTSLKGRRRRGRRRGSRQQEYSKRENAARPACRDFTYLTRNLHTLLPT